MLSIKGPSNVRVESLLCRVMRSMRRTEGLAEWSRTHPFNIPVIRHALTNYSETLFQSQASGGAHTFRVTRYTFSILR